MSTLELTWPYVSNFREVYEPALSALYQTEAVIGHLKSIYGTCVMDVPPPLLERLLNAAPWTFRWLQWFSESIRCVESMDGYASLRLRLTEEIRYDEALSVLQIADRLAAAGFAIGFDAPALVAEVTKYPDLVVEDLESNARFHCEVSVLYSAQDLVIQSWAVERLAGPIMFHGQEPFAFAGRLLRLVSKDEIERLRDKIIQEIQDFTANPSFREIVVDATLLLALAPQAEKARIEQWADRNGMPPYSFSGFPAGGDGRARLRYKIYHKAKQLPLDQPNLLAIFAHDLFLQIDLCELMSLGAEIIASYPNIASLILLTEDYNPAPTDITSIGSNFLAVSARDGLTHYSLVIQNPHCSVPHSPTTQDKLLFAFSC